MPQCQCPNAPCWTTGLSTREDCPNNQLQREQEAAHQSITAPPAEKSTDAADTRSARPSGTLTRAPSARGTAAPGRWGGSAVCWQWTVSVGS